MKKISKLLLVNTKLTFLLTTLLLTSSTAFADISIIIRLNDAEKSVNVEASGNIVFTDEVWYDTITSPLYSNKVTSYNDGGFFAGNNYSFTDLNFVGLERVDEGAADWVFDTDDRGYGYVGLTDTSWGDTDRLYIYIIAPNTLGGSGSLYLNKSFFGTEGTSLSSEYAGYNAYYDEFKANVKEQFGDTATFKGYRSLGDTNLVTIRVVDELEPPRWIDSEVYGMVYSYSGNDTDANQWLWQWESETFIYTTEAQVDGIWVWFAK